MVELGVDEAHVRQHQRVLGLVAEARAGRLRDERAPLLVAHPVGQAAGADHHHAAGAAGFDRLAHALAHLVRASRVGRGGRLQFCMMGMIGVFISGVMSINGVMNEWSIFICSENAKSTPFSMAPSRICCASSWLSGTSHSGSPESPIPLAVSLTPMTNCG